MNKIAIAFSTKDRIELSRQSLEPLVNGQHALFWIDGSLTEEGQALPLQEGYPCTDIHLDVTGGSCRAIVYALTIMLKHRANYTHVGLVENDVLLSPDWFEPTFALFERGRQDGLKVGAASARCYEDRILCQRDGYALMHNLGAGMIILTREAAELILHSYRTMWTTENRRAYAQLCGVDIGSYWAFRSGEHHLVADWMWDRLLSTQLGLASLALTPSPCEMIGQDPPLAMQGLTLAKAPVEARINDAAFERYVERTFDIRNGLIDLNACGARYRGDDGGSLIFAHQLPSLEGAVYHGEWRLRWSQGFGPFAWRATQKGDSVEAMVSGPFDFLVSGGADGGEVEVLDAGSGFVTRPRLPSEGVQGQMLHLMVPAQVAYRKVRLTALAPGVSFYGLRCREPQLTNSDYKFDDTHLPPVE